MNRDKKHEEKERLMEEVLNKDRSYKMDPKDAVELSFKTKENVEDIADTMKRSDEALDSLKAILEKQQKDLENLGFLNAENQTDMDKLQQELEAEYNIHKEAETVALKEVDAQVFDEIKKEVQTRVVIEEETLQDLVTAFRRPFVMGENKGQAKNVIIVTGPRGSNRHASIAAIARSMYERQIFVSDEVYTIDMSLYQSNSQEQIFLQDL